MLLPKPPPKPPPKPQLNAESDAETVTPAADSTFRSWFMNMAEGAAIHEIVVDDAGEPTNYRILQVNPNYQRLTGLAPDQVVGKLAHEAYGTREPPFLQELCRPVLEGRSAQFEAYIARLDRHCAVSVAPLGPTRFVTVLADISECRAREKALRETARFLQQSQRIGHLGSFRLHLPSGTWVSSPALDQVLGIDSSFPRDLAGARSLILPEEREGLIGYVRNKVVAERQPFERRLRISRKCDGEVRWLSGFGELEVEEEGGAAYIIGTLQDITDIVDAEVRLKRKTEELDRLFSLIPDLLCVADSNARLLRVNAAWERVLGWSPQELEGRPYIDLVHVDDRAATLEARRNLEHGASVIDLINRLRCRDGSYRALEWRSSPGEDGRSYGTARDVTDWLEPERALRESEERYRLLVELSPLMVAIHVEGKIVFINSAGVAMAGAKSAEQILGRSVLDFVPDERRRLAQERVDHSLQLAEPARALEQRLLRLDGETRDIEVHAVRFPYQGTLATLMVASDVTERKRGEHERRDLEKQLQQSQRLESVGRLAGGVAHDFNNLLTVIMSCADDLVHSPGLDAAVRSEASDISDAARRAADLTRQLLALSRRQVLQPRVVVLGEVVTSAARMLKRILGEDIDLEVLDDGNRNMVFADPGQIEQVLVNLAVNARDAMPTGGRLTLKTEGLLLDEASATERFELSAGSYVMLSVHDTGVGMDDSTRARAFDPFFTTKGAKGTGLGLATVYGIIKQSGGHVSLHSQLGVGTTFEIYLPRASQTASTHVSRLPLDRQPGTETVLLVEDEECVRSVVERILVRAGYTVLGAEDGDQALRLSEQHAGPIHLLLTDLVMPGMTGRELANRVATKRTNTRVLYMSGYAPESVLHDGVLEEGVNFIAKPVSPAQLLRKVRETLGSL